MRAKHIVLAVGAAWVGLAACDALSVRPITTNPPAINGPIVDLTGDTSTDPYACAVIGIWGGSSVVNGKEIDAVYDGGGGAGGGMGWSGKSYGAVCLRDGTNCQHLGGAGRGSDGRVTGEALVLCQFSCQVDADCPAPETGTSVARCGSLSLDDPNLRPGLCALYCNVDEECPDGFRCVQPYGTSPLPDGGTASLPTRCLQWKDMSALVSY